MPAFPSVLCFPHRFSHLLPEKAAFHPIPRRAADAESEAALVGKMRGWCAENLAAERIDEGLFAGEELPEEQKYFKRTEKMKQMIEENGVFSSSTSVISNLQ